ncbi:MAG: hypothetical protein VXA46_00830 [Aquiluna sp.]
MSRATESGTSMALISKTGAALEALILGGKQLIHHNAANNRGEIFFGSILAPWPNRLAGGTYELGGKEFVAGKLDADSNANHGLVFDRDFELITAGETEITLGYQFGGDAGYPFSVRLEIHFELGDTFLRVSAEATNTGASPAPFAIGFHPYFLAPEPFELSGDFTTVIDTDSRMLPTATRSVGGLRFTGGEIDACYLGSKDATLKTSAHELVVELEENLDRMMFYRPGKDQGDSMLAIEPMSAPPNAFSSEIQEHLLEPSEARNYSFRIRTR